MREDAEPIRREVGEIDLSRENKGNAGHTGADVLRDALYRISEAVDSSGSLEELYGALHTIIRDVMPADNFYIAYYDKDDDLLSFPYFVDELDDVPSPRKSGTGLTEYVLRTGKSLLATQDIQKKLEENGKLKVVGALPHIWLGVPLRAEALPIGIIAVQHYSDTQAYGERDLYMLEYVSTQVAKAIERKRAEEALKVSEDLNRGIVANTPLGIIYLDQNGTIIYENQAMEKMMDVPEGSASGVIGKRIMDIPNIIEAGVHDLVQKILTGDVIRNVELNYKSLFNRQLKLKVHGAPRKGANDEIIGAIIMCEDITNYKKLEAQFQQAQKMEAVGRLAGGVAHDFNNILTVIFGHAELAMMTMDESDPARRHILEVMAAGDRATDLIRQLLAFSRKQVIAPGIININKTLPQMERMLKRLIGEDVELKFLLDSGLGMVKADPAQIDQVIVNLAVNARDAMPGGGKITIETENVELDASFAETVPGSVPGPYVRISITDTGHGMSQEVMAHIFEPFFTTKPKEKGTGLGLSTVYGIVKQNSGFVSCYSEEGHGTTFKIYFPRVIDGKETVQAKQPEVKTPIGKEIILVVEDEKTVRKLAVGALEQFGYTVLEAGDGGEALEICREQEQPVDLILSDVIMPTMSGPEMVEKIRDIWEDVKVLYMSGYTENSIVNHGILKKGIEYISKPFRPRELITTVRKVLDKPPAARNN
jgi:PAS domain S-box-containing protein